MKTSHLVLAAFVLVMLAVVVGSRLLLDDASAPPAEDASAGPRPLDSQQLPALPPSGVAEQAPPAGSDTPLPPLPESTVDAAVSMKQALEHGDPAAPPVVRDAPAEKATAAELADPKAYQQYEARQSQRLYNQYVKAANDEIPRLQADIERARAAGLPPEQLAEGEEKLRRIQAMRDQLQAEKGATPAP